jgi:hypothetical protein
MKISVRLFLLTLMAVIGCNQREDPARPRTFREDLEFLRNHVDVIRLTNRGNHSQLLVVPAWQGRVMTSTNGGTEGPSFGWINYPLISSGEILRHINPFGGEDRFWIGPEGGQFSVFFEPGDPFDLDHWQTPAVVDTEPFETVAASESEARFTRRARLRNYTGTPFDFRIDRRVLLLNRSDAEMILGSVSEPQVEMVAFASENRITNLGEREWTRETGLLSIWILGMYPSSPSTTVLIPFELGSEEKRGPIVNDRYFGKVPEDRLDIRKGVIYFRADGKHRSKIGVGPLRAKSVMGSYESSRNLLTIVQYSRPDTATGYVNSMWEIQQEPYGGDVINSYNDGPPEPGAKPLGPFYELETSSPAAALGPSETLLHVHRTFHFSGPEEQLQEIACRVLGVSLSNIPNWQSSSAAE